MPGSRRGASQLYQHRYRPSSSIKVLMTPGKSGSGCFTAAQPRSRTPTASLNCWKHAVLPLSLPQIASVKGSVPGTSCTLARTHWKLPVRTNCQLVKLIARPCSRAGCPNGCELGNPLPCVMFCSSCRFGFRQVSSPNSSADAMKCRLLRVRADAAISANEIILTCRIYFELYIPTAACGRNQIVATRLPSAAAQQQSACPPASTCKLAALGYDGRSAQGWPTRRLMCKQER